MKNKEKYASKEKEKAKLKKKNAWLQACFLGDGELYDVTL